MSEGLAFETVVMDVEHQGMRFDVRCFLVPHASGLVLVDTGVPGTAEQIAAALDRLGAAWGDITDVVLTHKHFDHVASLADVISLAGTPAVWAGDEDRAEIRFDGVISALSEGDRVRDLVAVTTPGHTPGHRSVLHEPSGVLFAGDVAGTMDGVLTRGPQPFTDDPARAEQSLQRLSAMAWERIVFAHGPELADPRGDLRRLLGGEPG